MENIWNLENIKKLFFCAAKADKEGKSLASVFASLAREFNCSTGSIRNYYYSQTKLFRLMPSLAREMGIESFATRAKPFTTFDESEMQTLLIKALVNKAAGKSVRSTLLELAGGDSKIALRYQNKYRSLLIHHKKRVLKIMDELKKQGVEFFNPYTRAVVRPGMQSDIEGVLERVGSLSGEEKEMLLRKILL